MFSVRTFALGPISFLAGFLVVTMQSVIDEVPIRSLHANDPVVMGGRGRSAFTMTLINLLFGPQGAAVAERGVRKVLTDLEPH